MADITFDATVTLVDGTPTVTSTTGPRSLTAFVITMEASIEVNLINGLPTGWLLAFDTLQPLLWHDFCGNDIGQPSWISDVQTSAEALSLTDSNPATAAAGLGGPTRPIIATFTPQFVAVDPAEARHVVKKGHDPTIINVDPVGG